MKALINVRFLDCQLHRKKKPTADGKSWEDTGEVDFKVQILEKDEKTGRVDVRELTADTEAPKDFAFLDLVSIEVEITPEDRENKSRIRLLDWGAIVRKSFFAENDKPKKAI